MWNVFLEDINANVKKCGRWNNKFQTLILHCLSMSFIKMHVFKTVFWNLYLLKCKCHGKYECYTYTLNEFYEHYSTALLSICLMQIDQLSYKVMKLNKLHTGILRD